LGACTSPEPPVLDEPFPISVPAGENVLGPRLSQGPDGAVLLSWMRRDESGATLRFSSLDSDKWGPAVDVVSDPRMFVNWADLPSVQPLGEDYWVAHWLSKSGPDVYAYDVLLAFSTDQGHTWGDAIRPYDDDAQTEHGFVSIYPDADAAALLWLDGRKTINETTDNPSASSMTLRAAVVTQDGTRQAEQLVDDIVCDCCQTDVAVATDGPIAVYRNRTADEIRDIYVTRFRDGLWEPGVALADDGWKITGCPVNGPAIDAQGDTVAIAWFSAANDRPVVRALLSTNGGKTFNEPVEIAARKVSGHVGVAIVDRHSAAVSWVESDNRGTNAIKLRSVTSAGLLGPAQVVGRSELRHIYPQMVRSDDLLILAWTDERNDATRLASVKVPILGFYER
jgi:hypothetical protein